MHTTVDVPGPRAALVNQNIRVPPTIRRRGRGRLNQNVRVPPTIRRRSRGHWNQNIRVPPRMCRRGREHPHYHVRIPPRARQPASWGAEALCVLLKLVLRALLSSRLLWRPFRRCASSCSDTTQPRTAPSAQAQTCSAVSCKGGSYLQGKDRNPLRNPLRNPGLLWWGHRNPLTLRWPTYRAVRGPVSLTG